MNSSLQVYARIKPGSELEYGVTPSVDGQTSELQIRTQKGAQSFLFTGIFGEKADQAEIFSIAGRSAVDSCFQGLNSTIFAYGQTASGKTFTISGSENWEKRGLIPRAISYIFDQLEAKKKEKIELKMSCLEIYNEGVYDLLDAANLELPFEKWQKVPCGKDESGNVVAKGLSLHRCKTEQDGIDLLMMSSYMRRTASTALNLNSSRSHCIFSIHFDMRKGVERLQSKLSLVDLAGSERVSKSKLDGKLLSEAKHINLSLTFLEQVIVSLSLKQRFPSKAVHVPYRNSVLTALLQNSLGGNCQTTMVACLALTQKSQDESIATAQFAKRCAGLKTQVVRNLSLDPNEQNKQLIQENDFLRDEIVRLREKLRAKKLSEEFHIQKLEDEAEATNEGRKKSKEKPNIESLLSLTRLFFTDDETELDFSSVDEAKKCMIEAKKLFVEKNKEHYKELKNLHSKLLRYEAVIAKNNLE